MTNQQNTECRCDQAVCGCAAAPSTPCTCGETCNCRGGCDCAGGCDCPAEE